MDFNLKELEKDIDELNKLLEITKRPNIVRNLENQKKTIEGLLDSEKKLVEKHKEKINEELVDIKKENDQLNREDKYQYTSVTKYAFESTEKFAK